MFIQTHQTEPTYLLQVFRIYVIVSAQHRFINLTPKTMKKFCEFKLCSTETDVKILSKKPFEALTGVECCLGWDELALYKPPQLPD